MADDELSKKVSDDIDPETGNFRTSPEDSPAISTSNEIENQKIEEEFRRIKEQYRDVPEFEEAVKEPMLEYMSNAIKAGRVTREEAVQVDTLELMIPALELSSLCRQAFATHADNIIFLDKSARRYGELVKQVLPIFRLEYAKLYKKPLAEIALPEIKFINPPIMAHYSDLDKLRQMVDNKTNILYDEGSTYSESSSVSNPKLLKPKDQYKYYDESVNDEDLNYDTDPVNNNYRLGGSYEKRQYSHRRKEYFSRNWHGGSLARNKWQLEGEFPNAKFDMNVGSANGIGGHLAGLFWRLGVSEASGTISEGRQRSSLQHGIIQDSKDAPFSDDPVLQRTSAFSVPNPEINMGEERKVRDALKIIAKAIMEDVEQKSFATEE